MRILVISDTHGSHRNIELALEAQPKARHIIFCGDGLNEINDTQMMYKDRIFHKVCGNCDWFSNEKKSDIITIGRKKIFFTHGHLYSVKFDINALITAAKSQNADIVLFGHTHQAYQNYIDGMFVLNPGSASNSSFAASYGYVDITDAGIVTNIVRY